VKPAWLQQRERGTILGLRLGVVIAFFLGRKLTRLLLYPVCLYFLLFSVRSRRASRDYLSRVLPRAPRFSDLFQHYLTFATVALDRFFLLNNRYELYDIEIHGAEILQQTLDGGQGCLLLGAHIGSFEVLRAAGSAHELKVAMVMYEDNAKNINTVAKDVDPDARSRIIELGRLDSMFKVYERLQQDAWVGMLADRILPGGEQMAAEFLGGTASFPTAPYRIALMLRRPVLFMTGLYRGANRYELHFEKLFDAQAVSRTARAAAVAQALHCYAQRLEHYCRIAPYNWFNFYDFWHAGAQHSTSIHGEYLGKLAGAGFPGKTNETHAGDRLYVDQPASGPPSYGN
jgi:predicted LPLAT superfamily acyltransferase